MRKALILVAHADDETLGAGGVIQKLVKRDWAVSVVIMSDGVLTSRGETQDNREDARRACAVLGVEAPTFLGFKDQYFDTFPMADLANAAGALGIDPDLIITHADTDLNLDHRMVSDVAKIIGRPKRKPVAILACEIPSTTNWNGETFPANYYVGIDDEIERKIEAFAEYSGELQPDPQPWSREGLRTLARYHGMQSGHAYAEAFVVVRGGDGLLP